MAKTLLTWHTVAQYIKNNRIFLVQLLILLIFSTIVIFFQFPSIPGGLAFDEVENSNLALRLTNQPYTPYTEYATGHATLYYYIIAFSQSVFGINTFALRLPAAVFSVGAVLVFFLLMRLAFPQHKHIAFVLAFLFVTTRWFYNFTRFSFQGPFLIFLELLSLLFVFMYIRKEKNGYIALSGVCAGLAFNSYQPGRIFFLVPLSLFIIHALITHGRKYLRTREFIKPFLSFGIPFVIGILPLSLYLAGNPDIRIQQQLYLTDPSLSLGEKAGFLFENITKTLQMFHFQGDLNGRHNYPGKPALNIITGLLFVAGGVIALLRHRTLTSLVFAGYLAVALVPTLLTYPSENPHMLRTITAIPAVVYFSGIALHAMYQSVLPYLGRKTTYASIIIMGIIGVSALYDMRTYYVYQRQVFPAAFPITIPLEEAVELDPETLPQ